MSSKRERFRRRLPLITLLTYTFVFHVGLFFPYTKTLFLTPTEEEKAALKYPTSRTKFPSKYSLADIPLSDFPTGKN